MSSGQYKKHHGFNKSILNKEGNVILLQKDGRVKETRDREGNLIKK